MGAFVRAGQDAAEQLWDAGFAIAWWLRQRLPFVLALVLGSIAIAVFALVTVAFVVAWTALMFFLLFTFWWLFLIVYMWTPRDD